MTCPKCEGNRQVWEKWYDFDIETWITGYRTCTNCRGSGIVYLYSSVSYALAFFFGLSSSFSLIFAVDYGATALRLDWNPWVKDVKEVRYWFNPMYFVWLFHVNRKKWVEWTTALSLIATLIVVPMIALPLTSYQLISTPMLGQNIFAGWLIGTVLTIPFAIAWYQNYEDLSKLL